MTAKKILAIFGATGNQGGGLANYVLADPELSATYSVRAITRDIASPKAQALKQKGAEVVAGDITDPASLKPVLRGAHTVFLMTAPVFGPNAVETEVNHARNAADAAVEVGVEYLIFSTLPNVSEISGGKYTKVTAFDAKARAEAYIRTLPLKSAFYCPASFMENFHTPGFILQRPSPTSPDTTILSRHNSPTAKFPLIACVADTGKFVGAILADPDKYVGKTLCAAEGLYSWEEIVDVYSKVTGRKTVYEQGNVEEYRASLPEIVADVFVEGFSFYDEFGYYGPGMEDKIEWAKEQARGGLTSLEEYFREHPKPFA